MKFPILKMDFDFLRLIDDIYIYIYIDIFHNHNHIHTQQHLHSHKHYHIHMHIQSQSQLTNKFNSHLITAHISINQPINETTRQEQREYTRLHIRTRKCPTIIIYKYIYIYTYNYTRPLNTLTPSRTFSTHTQAKTA